MISKKGKGSTKKPAIYIPPGQLTRGLGRGKGVKTNKVLVDEQESNERINGGIENHTLTLHYGGKQVKDNDFSEDYSYLDILKLCSKFIEENKHLKNEMAELRILVQKLAGNKSGNLSSGPSHIPSINDDRDVCDDDEVNFAGEDSDGCDYSDGTRDDGVKDKSCVGPGFSFDGSV